MKKIIFPPGTIFTPSPCAHCRHKTCAKLRATAARNCTICGKPIGYTRTFYDHKSLGVDHADCFEESLRAEVEAKPLHWITGDHNPADCPECRKAQNSRPGEAFNG